MDPADPTALWLDPPLPTESEPLPQVPLLLETTLAVLLCVPVGLVGHACAYSRVRTWAHFRRALVLAHAMEGYIQVGQREWSLPRAIAAAFETSPTLTIARASEGVGDVAGVSHVADGASAEVACRVPVQGALPPVVAVAVDSVATGVVLVRIDACASRSGPIIVVVSVVVAVLRRRVIAGQIARVVADDVDAMATGGHGFLQPMEAAKVVHSRRVHKLRHMNGIVTKHAASSSDEVVPRAVGAREAVGLEVVGVHEPISLIDIIRVAIGRVARPGVTVVAHVVLVDVGTLHVVNVHVPKVCHTQCQRASNS